MIYEERKFITYERIRRRGLYNMLDYPKVIAYAKRYFKIDMSKKDYLFIIENYSDLSSRYLR